MWYKRAFRNQDTLMAEIVNLRHARKVKVPEDAAAKAEGNRLKFGLTKAEKHLDHSRLNPKS
jgi:Domain of unknown function (DUF4169)